MWTQPYQQVPFFLLSLSLAARYILRRLKVRKNANISIFCARFVPNDRESVLKLACITEKILLDILTKVPG